MTRKVLIVEDERELGMLLGEHLRRWGFEPTILGEGKHVVAWVQQNRPAAVLLDLMLPDLDGYTLCEALKLNRDTNLIPIVMVTALNHREDLIRGLEVGANRYLTKPFSSENLREAVYDAIAWQENLLRGGTQGEVTFRLQSDPHHLEELNSMLGSLLLFSGLTQQQSRQLTTAVRELGTNAIEWGHQKQSDRIVSISYRIDPQKISIKIRDTGPGFDPGNLPHAADPEDPIAHMMVRETLGLREGGFGILMSRGLVDELKYNELGNEVELIKYFSPKDHLNPDESRQGACQTAN